VTVFLFLPRNGQLHLFSQIIVLLSCSRARDFSLMSDETHRSNFPFSSFYALLSIPKFLLKRISFIPPLAVCSQRCYGFLLIGGNPSFFKCRQCHGFTEGLVLSGSSRPSPAFPSSNSLRCGRLRGLKSFNKLAIMGPTHAPPISSA